MSSNSLLDIVFTLGVSSPPVKPTLVTGLRSLIKAASIVGAKNPPTLSPSSFLISPIESYTF